MSRRRKALSILMRARMRSSPSPSTTTTTTTTIIQPTSDISPVQIATSSPASGDDNNTNPPFRAAGVTKDLKGLIQTCVSDSADTTLEDFLQGYYNLSTEERKEVLLVLAIECDVDRARVRCLMQQYLSIRLPCSSGDVEDKTQGQEDGSVVSSFHRIEHNLRMALKPKYGIFVEQLNAYPGGLKLLVDVRGDLLSMLKEKNIAPLRALDAILKEKLVSWLSPASLELHQITWDDSASILEKIVAYEAVHPIRNLLDLKRRLSVGRRCFGYLHPAIPGEPLIFIEVALLKNIAQSIQDVLWDSPPIPENEATCALFYSISSTQAGLAGINLGKFLIKRVIELLKREMPQVLTFATLSPIPGYMQWLRSKLVYHLKLADSMTESMLQDGSSSTFSEYILHPEEERAITAACPVHITGRNGMEIMQKLLTSPKNEWTESDQLLAVLRPPLMRLCARYLLKEKKRGKALDVVANFHLQNGAMIERLNWMADRSVKGLHQSGGIMVNYVYRTNKIEENAQSYSRLGTIQASHPLCLYVEDNDYEK